MASRVENHDSSRWAESFLARLDRLRRGRGAVGASARRAGAPSDRRPCSRTASKTRTILLDYETASALREIVGHPDLAGADPRDSRPSLRAGRSAGDDRPRRQRPHPRLARVVAGRPLGLALRRARLPRARPAGGDWQIPFDVDLSWLARVERLFWREASDVPGTMVERKAASVSVGTTARRSPSTAAGTAAWELLVALENVLAGSAAGGPSRAGAG